MMSFLKIWTLQHPDLSEENREVAGRMLNSAQEFEIQNLVHGSGLSLILPFVRELQSDALCCVRKINSLNLSLADEDLLSIL